MQTLITPSSSCRPVEKDESALGEVAWDVDQGLIAQLKERYRKERKGKKGVKSKSSSGPRLVLSPPSSPHLTFLSLLSRPLSLKDISTTFSQLCVHENESTLNS